MSEFDKCAAALGYVARGFAVFPVYEMESKGVCACGKRAGEKHKDAGKHPRTKHGFKDATKDPKKVADWWKDWPNANIGIATGKASGLTVIDADISNGKPGLDNLTALCGTHGLPETLTVRTGSGGLHLYFKYAEIPPNGEDVLDEAIDVRNDGGYVIAPPSNHKSGGVYTFEDQDAPLLPVPEYFIPQKKRAKPRATNAEPPHAKLTLEQVKDALHYIDPSKRKFWIDVGRILGREYGQREAFYKLYETWCMRASNFGDEPEANIKRMRDVFYKGSLEKPASGDELTIGTLILWAKEGGWIFVGARDEVYEKFYAVRPANKFIYLPSGAMWPGESVNAVLPLRDKQRPALWLMRNRGVDSVVFDPALEQITQNAVAREQGVVADTGSTLLNRYQPSLLTGGDAHAGERWAKHVRKLFPDPSESDHVIHWCAHRVQRPGEKVRHALVFGGPPGVGKDTIIEAIIPALGAWNCSNIAPDQLFAPFNEHEAKVLVRISEVVDLHEMTRFKFFEGSKTLIAGSPDYLEINPKYGAKYHARNVAGVVMTTNHATSGMYLPADDRRHYPIETIQLWGTPKEREDYFSELWSWLLNGGFADVAAYLRAVDLSAFNASAPPPKTECFNKIVAHGMSGDAWLMDGLDALAQTIRALDLGDVLLSEELPLIVRLDDLRDICMRNGQVSREEFNKRIAMAMTRTGYDLYPNPNRKDRRHNLQDGAGKDGVTVTVYVAKRAPTADYKALLDRITKPHYQGAR